MIQHSPSASLARITPEQVRKFREEGYTTLGPIVTEDQLNALEEQLQKLMLTLPQGRTPEHLDMLHPGVDFLIDFLSQDHILDIVEPIVGPNIVLFASHFICKPPGVGKRVPWHQDSGYWQMLEMPRKVVTIWLAMDPSTPENGCMRVIPGSHRYKYENYEEVKDRENSVFSTSLDRNLIDEAKAVDVILPKGHCSLHDGWTIHGSNANASNLRRCGYTMRYFAPEQINNKKTHPLYLVRGKDNVGKNVYVKR